MAITERDEERVEYAFVMAFLPDLPENDETADKALEAWNLLWELMERENNFSDQLGSNVLDWQIRNWANDTTMLLQNTRRYKDVIAVNEQILKIQWSRNDKTDLFHENAKREIADTYADMGEIEKAYRLYEEYLESDPLWGWGWIGYYRLFKYQKNPHYIDIMKDLCFGIQSGKNYRDAEDLYRELSDEFAELGESDISKSLKEKYELEVDRKRNANRDSLMKSIEKLEKKIQINFGRKIYPNESCPCGSGKKYKKCCGRK
ncbi:MAG: YecA family protein [Floccifex sp.]